MTGNNPIPASRLWITGHRGASGHAPENTLVAIETALLMGADSIEIDVQLSADGAVVLMHDATLDRTTDGSGYVSELSLTRLKEYDAGSWYGPKFRGEPIPTLPEVLETVRDRARLNIELKAGGDWEELTKTVVQIIGSQGFINDSLVTSFNQKAVELVKELDDGIATGLIVDEFAASIFSGKHEILSMDFKLINDDFLAEARRAGKEVHVWTVNREKDMLRMLNFGVAGIMTNYPDRLHKLLLVQD